MNFLQLFRLPYLLDKNPTGDFLWGFPLLAFFLLAMFIGNIMQNPAKKNKYLKKSLKKKLWPFQILGGIGIVLILARFSEMETLSMRIFLLITFLITIFLGTFTFWKVNKEYKRRLKSVKRAKLKKK